MTPEGKVKGLVKEFLDMLGNDVYRFMPVQTGYGMPTLDYLLCIKGHFIAIETKRKGKVPTPRQETIIAKIEQAGGRVFVVDGPESLARAAYDILNIIYKGREEWPLVVSKILLPLSLL